MAKGDGNFEGGASATAPAPPSPSATASGWHADRGLGPGDLGGWGTEPRLGVHISACGTESGDNTNFSRSTSSLCARQVL
jgi:hypothetical protein